MSEDLFTVGRVPRYSFLTKSSAPTYCVYLPHSCDEWVITEEVSKENAISELEDFINQARIALDKLKSL